ncbi:MAG: hypothetical protein NZL96_01845 [Patescibacteria group bacterium]|nr:hypothetical protein [Patescibacteria group bacterium]
MIENQTRTKLVLSSTIFIFILILFIFVKEIKGQSELPLVVIPSRQEIEVSPGEKKYLNVNFFNQSNEPISGFFRVVDFVIEDSQGTPRLIERTEEANPRFAAASWFKLMYDRATLPKNNKVSLQAELNVPLSARPGGRYVAIFFEYQPRFQPNQTQNSEVGSGTSSRIASLIYIKVKGPIFEQAMVSRFFAPRFQEYGPIKVETQILNRSNYHVAPKGIITLKDLFNREIGSARLKEENIFPDMIRNYEYELGQKWMIGKYRLNLVASYGTGGKTLESSTEVWIFPWRIALLILLTLTIITIFVHNFYKNLIRKNLTLEEELRKEKEEIERLKRELRKRNE